MHVTGATGGGNPALWVKLGTRRPKIEKHIPYGMSATTDVLLWRYLSPRSPTDQVFSNQQRGLRRILSHGADMRS